MNKKIYGLMIIILIAALLLTACERPASKAPTAVPTKSGEIPFPVATQPQIMLDILKGTQTAAALTPQTGGLPALVTSTPAFTFNTPLPGTTPVVLTTPTPTRIAYPTPTPGIPATYTIMSGEFVYCIARRFDRDPVDMLNLNGLNINSRPAIGAVLKIPASGSFPGARALKAHPTTYTVVAGDTIGKIACGFGDADPNTIFAANGLAVGTALTPGQVLQIP
jgi:LysM repeat protein